MTRRGWRAPAAVTAAAAAVTLLTALAGPVAAQPAPGGGVAGTTVAGASGPHVSLVSQPTWLRPGGRFDVRLRLTGAPADAAVRMVVHAAPDSRKSLQHTFEGHLGGVVATGPRQLVGQLAKRPDGTVAAGFALGPGGISLPGRGAYPVEVQLLAAGGQQLDSFVTYLTYLTGKTPEFKPLDVAVVFDIAAPPTFRPDGGTGVDPGTLRRLTERVDALAATPRVALTVAPQPETVDGVAAAGGIPGGVVKDLRDALDGRLVLSRPYVDVDLDALRQAGLTSEARNQLIAGGQVAHQRLSVEPTPGTWLAGPTLGDAAARMAVQLGLDRALVPPTVLAGGGGDQPEVPAVPVRLGPDGPRAMVSDPELAHQLVAGQGVLGAHRFLAELATQWLEAPANHRGVAVRLPADADLDPAALAVALGGLTDGQAVTAVTLDTLFDDLRAGGARPDVVDLAPHRVDHDLRAIAGSVRTARAGVDGLSGLIDDANLAGSLRRSLLISTGVATPDGDRAAYVGRVNQALSSVTGSVSLPERFRITLTSRSSTIPVTVINNTSRNLSVMVQLDSDQLQFPEGPLISQRLVPGTTRLDVPVRVRTSGAFTLNVRVTSPDGTVTLDTSTFDVRSTAISGVGLLLSIGAALFLAVWWLRHWRSSRRSRHLMPRSSAADDTGPPGAGGDTDGDGNGPVAEPPYRPAHLAGHIGDRSWTRH